MSDLPRIASDPELDRRIRVSAEIQVTGRDYFELDAAARDAAERFLGRTEGPNAHLHIREVVPIEAVDGTPHLYVGIVRINYPWDDIF